MQKSPSILIELLSSCLRSNSFLKDLENGQTVIKLFHVNNQKLLILSDLSESFDIPAGCQKRSVPTVLSCRFQDALCDSQVTLRLSPDARQVLRARVQQGIENGNVQETYRLTEPSPPRPIPPGQPHPPPQTCFQLYSGSSDRYCITELSTGSSPAI